MSAPARRTVVRLIARLNVGGPAKHVTWLTARLDPARYRSVLACGQVEGNEDEMTAFVAAQGVTPCYLRWLRRSLGPHDLPALCEALALLWREQPDIIHTHTAKAGFVGRSAALIYNLLRFCCGRPRARVFHTFHGHTFRGYHSPRLNRIILAIERFLARSTDAIITISPRQRDEICGTFAIGRPEQYRVIPLGLDLSAYAQAAAQRGRLRAMFHLPADAAVIGIVGRLTAIKNHRRFLAVCARLRERHAALCARRRVRFAIIGDGELRQPLETEARALGLEPDLFFTGNLDDQLVYLPDLAVLTLTSDNEGTPLTIIEALACSVPVVAGDVGGVADLLGASERGLLVCHDDIDAYADALAALLDDEPLAARLAERGRDYVLARHSVERLVGDIDRLYSS
ncbi:MAG TPA: glycosyltransferase [bacterium]|nr:glycosyltransferase [bacterium]